MPQVSPSSLPTVRLEVRNGSARPALHEVSDIGFLIGSVPGCDLRLPGADLPPVICLISRCVGGASIRKLVPTQPLLVNGRSVATSVLSHGDRLTMGTFELLVQVQSPPATKAAERGVVFSPINPSLPSQEHEAEQKVCRWELEEYARQLDLRRQQLEEQTQELETDRMIWYRRREEIEQECRQQEKALAAGRRRLNQPPQGPDPAAAGAASRKAELDAQAAELAQARQLLEEQSRALAARQQEWERDRDQRQADYQAREQQLSKEQETLEKDQAQYQADLVRLDRLQATIEQRRQQLQERAREVDQRFEQLQRDSRELEEQARQLNEWHDKLRGEATRLDTRQAEQEAAGSQLGQRAAALEGQQVMLASLRTRLERMREEVRREQQQAADQQARLDEAEADLQRRLQEAQQLRAKLDNEKHLCEQERRQFEERRSVLDGAVNELHQAQDALAAKDKELELRELALSASMSQQADETSLSQAKSAQVLEMQQRLTADREALRAREAALLQAEQAREALQEQLRRRSEELAARQRTLTEQARKQAEEIAALESRRGELERERQNDDERSAALRQELDARAAELEQLRSELAQRQEKLHRHVARLKQAGRNIGASRKALSEERAQWEAAQQAASESAARNRVELEAAQREAVELQKQLPELELRAQAAVERLAQAREQLREHLAELHAYARQNQEDIEALRAQVQADAEHVQQQRLAFHRARHEQRLAVAAFRQQLIEWQGEVTEMKHALAQGESRLEHRQVQVDEQARQIDASSARLAQQAEQLQEQERVVAEQRGEMQRHLSDLREWYRCKLRDLNERRQAKNEACKSGTDKTETVDLGPDTGARAILTLNEEVEPGDRILGERLRSLDLVDADTLTSLLFEARSQRRSLRQVLLAGGYLTLYQMALIETGNVDGLVLGPLRVIDRLRVTPREVAYRVFDPRRGHEAVLRHLAEAEMEEAMHADDFRQRFRQAAAVQDQHLMATYEVLEIGGRPAVLQEGSTGLPSTDWPGLAGVPGVWYRLVCQAAHGLHAAHQAGLMHGHLQPGLFTLTGEGIVKLNGLGDPPWLVVPPVAEQSDIDPATDFADFGRVAAGWLALAPRRQRAKIKGLGAPLRVILDRLRAETADRRYPTTAALLQDLDQAAASVPADSQAWDQLLQHVHEHVPGDGVLRQSA